MYMFVCLFSIRSPGAVIIGNQGKFQGLCILSSLLSKPGQNGFQEPSQDLRTDISQPAAIAHDQTVNIQTGGGTTLHIWTRTP